MLYRMSSTKTEQPYDSDDEEENESSDISLSDNSKWDLLLQIVLNIS